MGRAASRSGAPSFVVQFVLMGVRASSSLIVTHQPPSVLAEAWRRCQGAGTAPGWRPFVALRCEPPGDGGQAFSAAIPDVADPFWCGPPGPDPEFAAQVGAIGWALAREASRAGRVWVMGASDATNSSFAACVERGQGVWLDATHDGVRRRRERGAPDQEEQLTLRDHRVSCDRGAAEVLGREGVGIEELLDSFERAEDAVRDGREPRRAAATKGLPEASPPPGPDTLLPSPRRCSGCGGPIHSGDWTRGAYHWLTRRLRGLQVAVAVVAVPVILATLFVPLTSSQLVVAVIAAFLITRMIRTIGLALAKRSLPGDLEPVATCRSCGWTGRPAASPPA